MEIANNSNKVRVIFKDNTIKVFNKKYFQNVVLKMHKKAIYWWFFE